MLTKRQIYMKEYNKKWRLTNKEKKKEMDKNYRIKNKKYLSKKQKEYSKTKRFKDYQNYYRINKRDKSKISVRGKVRYAILTKRLIKQPCEICGELKVQAHHKDYNKPLEVNWLCIKHHTELHKKLKEEATSMKNE